MSNDPVKDHLLCAFLDEELSHDDVDSLLELLECDDVRARASRQSLAGSVLSSQKSLCVDISASVREAIAQEAPLQQAAATPTARRRAARRWFSASSNAKASRSARRRWQVPAAGVALAASVAVAAVVIVQPSAINGTANPMTASQASVGAAAVASAAQSEQLLATALQPQQSSNRNVRSVLTPRVPGAQLAAAGSNTSTRSTGRELVIAAPAQDRPVSAQWALADTQQATAQQVSNQRRVREQLNTYLINHARHGGGAALTGSLGYARVAARPVQNNPSE